MGQLLEVSDKIKSLRAVQDNPLLRDFLRKIGILVSKIIHRQGVTKNIGGVGSFVMHPEFSFCNYEDWGRGHNNGFSRLIALAGQKNVVFDVGAHIGLCCMPISKVLGYGGVCVAFEPAEENLAFLEWHVAANKLNNIRIIPCVVADKCLKETAFYVDEQCAGMSSICESKKGVGNYRRSVVKQISIDRYVDESRCIPELIKIDAEGAELKILSGSKDVLRKYHPEIILSVHPRQLKILRHSVEELVEVVHSMNYRIYDVNDLSREVTDQLGFKEYYLN